MKRRVSILVACSAAVVMLNGCFSGEDAVTDPNANPPSLVEEQTGPAWKLRLATTCRDDESGKCVGAHGFSILADGTFQVGPGPNNEILRGDLKPSEFKPIEGLLSRIESGVYPAAEVNETCASIEDAEAAATAVLETSVTLNRKGGTKALTRANASDFCFKFASAEDAKALHKAFKDLAKKYYPTPFPAPCTDAIAELIQLYDPLKACQTAADCAYLDVAYAPIPEGQIQFVVTDSCTHVRPLAVANRAQVEFAQEKLLNAKHRAKEVCGTLGAQAGCTGVSGFQASDAPPVCQQGVCKVNPTVSLD